MCLMCLYYYNHVKVGLLGYSVLEYKREVRIDR